MHVCMPCEIWLGSRHACTSMLTLNACRVTTGLPLSNLRAVSTHSRVCAPTIPRSTPLRHAHCGARPWILPCCIACDPPHAGEGFRAAMAARSFKMEVIIIVVTAQRLLPAIQLLDNLVGAGGGAGRARGRPDLDCAHACTTPRAGSCPTAPTPPMAFHVCSGGAAVSSCASPSH
jgi:hypothetical protein